jgi:hypothetical protein
MKHVWYRIGYVTPNRKPIIAFSELVEDDLVIKG